MTWREFFSVEDFELEDWIMAAGVGLMVIAIWTVTR